MSTTTPTTTTSSQILQQTRTFITEILSESALRLEIISNIRRKINKKSTLNSLNNAADALENAISSTNSTTTRYSFLRLSDKIIQSFRENNHNSFSLFLQSLIYSLRHQHVDAAISILDVFYTDPLLARTEISPSIFENLFLFYLIPVIQFLNEQKTRILPSQDFQFSNSTRNIQRLRSISTSVSGTRTLSRMSEEQRLKLKRVEKEYEQVLNENCKNLVLYFKEILKNRDQGNAELGSDPPPPVIVLINKKIEEDDANSEDGDPKGKVRTDEEIGFGYGRYNPIWAERGDERSLEFYSRSNSATTSTSTSPIIYPQRVSAQFFTNQITISRLNSFNKGDLESNPSLDYDSSSSSSESEQELEENNRKQTLFEENKIELQKQKQPMVDTSSCSSSPVMEGDSSPGSGEKHTPPKDFVCPITSNIFVDPVTLETGQTYERKAIQEWVERGNSTCPITRQKLQSTQLPKTNYVLKRLIASWQEKNPRPIHIQPSNSISKPDQIVLDPMKSLLSPTSVISQANIDGTISELPLAIDHLCMSEILSESEAAVLQIERFWCGAEKDFDIQNMLSKPAVINGFVEILFNSVDPKVLRTTVFLLTELGSRDKNVIQTLTRVDSDVDCIVALFKKGLTEAVVLIYMLRPSTASLFEMGVLESLVTVVQQKEEDMFELYLKPKTASVLLLGQILRKGEESNESSTVVQSIFSSNAVESVVERLQAEQAEERISAVRILLRCMLEDGKCRNVIADKAELAPILESFIGASDGEKFEIVHFLSELVKLNRRTFNEQLLHIIKDEGAFSMMHTLLIYLQSANQNQSPIVAGLLLQLDILVEPRKMSIYREEAIDVLISCLKNVEFPRSQIAAASTIVSLQGRFSYSGKPLARTVLLKYAGVDKKCTNFRRTELYSQTLSASEDNLEDEHAADEWERKMAFVLVSHEFGLLFEALAEGLESKYAEVASACFVAATWLTYMLAILPNTGIRGAARSCLLKHFVSIFKSTRDTEDKALALLSLRSFSHDPEGLEELTLHMKDIFKGIRELKKTSTIAAEMLKVFAKGQDSRTQDIWTHKELIQVDCSSNGEVSSIVCFNDQIFSGHSDGTLKVWSGKGKHLRLSQESREHSKAVTSMTVLSSGERLYTGSLDKTIRVWSIGNDAIHCIQVHDVKEQVNSICVANTISCFIPNGAGVKVHSWNGETKLLNPNKYVKCLKLVHGKLYCGCSDGSIQEIDLATGTISTIQTGTRKLLAKATPIYALQVRDGFIYSASSRLDGAAVKIWSTSNFSVVGSLPSNMDIRSMAISSELIYLGCKTGTVEIWCKEKHTRVESLQTGTNTKIISMAIDSDEELLVLGTSDGKIQVWGMT
ncbi:hypothetical protein MKW98_009951 [Papaver atlanticum]|uniref:RING-type E3 ubiquitin transferase n=1 Tax=Papaver atlanticum TaxID=357466 RepID=A0AAD4T199_9MAGN|nr:hypothetical protein MKW98_009951 [Papaver atlanticum]